MRRPNFLFIITDQQRADHLGCYGNALLRTPSIDALAARGMRFERHYVADPICMPNRATLITGRMPSVHGVRHNGISLPLETVTVADLLAAAGYRTALIGKAHFQNVTTQPPLFRGEEPKTGHAPVPAALAEARRSAQDWMGQEGPAPWADPAFAMHRPYYGFADVDLTTRHGDRTGGAYLHWARERESAIDTLRGRENALPTPDFTTTQGWRTRVPEELYSTSYVAERSVARLAEYARNPQQPFFMFCSFPDPHHPWTPPGRYWDRYRPDDIALPPQFWESGAHVDARHLDWYFAQRAARAAQAQIAGVPAAYACDEREAREAIALTYGMLSMVDHAVGKITAQLERLGLARDTVIVFTSDHGDYMGDHQMLLKTVLHYQGLVRTPLIWCDPAAPSRGTACTALTGAIDLTRTILDRAQVAPANGTQGHSLLPLIQGSTDRVREALLIEDESARPTTWLGHRARVRTLITARHRLSLFHGSHWGELYDLAEDPFELRNLWSDPASANTRAVLTERLVQEMLAHGETSPRPAAFA